MANGTSISGKKFARMRNTAVLTQEELAQLLGMSKGNVARIEGSGVTEIRQVYLRKLAELLKTTPEDVQLRLAPDKTPRVVVKDDDAALAAIVRRIASVRGLDPKELLETIEGSAPEGVPKRPPPKSLSRRRNKAGAR